jgi:hypothetical protein
MLQLAMLIALPENCVTVLPKSRTNKVQKGWPPAPLQCMHGSVRKAVVLRIHNHGSQNINNPMSDLRSRFSILFEQDSNNRDCQFFHGSSMGFK